MLKRCTSVSHCSGSNTITLRLRVAVMGGSRTKSVCVAKGVQGCLVGTEEQETPLGGLKGPATRGLGLVPGGLVFHGPGQP